MLALFPTDPWLFATAVFVLNATPGVDFLLTVTRTLQGGARAGIAAVAGIIAGCVAKAAGKMGISAFIVPTATPVTSSPASRTNSGSTSKDPHRPGARMSEPDACRDGRAPAA